MQILEITPMLFFRIWNFWNFMIFVKLKICEVVYRAFNKTLPVNLNNIFTVCEPNCLFNMRKQKYFVHKYTRTNLKAMSVSVVGGKLWNELDSNLRNTKTILLFKKKSNGVYYQRMYHMFEYLRFEKRCSTFNIIATLISLFCWMMIVT